MGRRINHKGATIPPPSEGLIRGMAIASWSAYKSTMELILDHEMPDWDELPEPIQDVWQSTAKAAYACVAMYGGAKLEKLDGPEDAKESA